MTSVLNIGADVRVNSTTTDEQEFSTVAALADGGYVVTWMSYQGSIFPNIYAQRYDALGHKVGVETRVNTTANEYESGPQVAATSDGGYVIVWSYEDSTNDIDEARMQRFDESGAKVGSEVRVDPYPGSGTRYGHIDPIVTYTADNQTVVAFTSYGEDGADGGVFVERYDDGGNPIGTAFQVNLTTNGDQYAESVTALTDGGFVVTWASIAQDGDNEGVYSRVFDADGTAVTGEVHVTTYTTKEQYRSTTTALADGGYVVTWQSDGQDGSGYGIYGQMFNDGGGKVGGEFHVSTSTANDQKTPAIAALTDGGFVIAWESQPTSVPYSDIYIQRYDALGNALGGEMRVNTTTAGDQHQVGLAALPGGGFVVTWTSADELGVSDGIYQKVFSNTTNLTGTQYLYGTPDADDLDGGAGTDHMYGGAGNDVYHVNAVTDDVVEKDGQGIDLVISTADGYELPEGVENLTLSGAAVIGYGNYLNNVITGNDGNNELHGESGNDVISGGNGNDTLYGDDGNDTLSGGSGNDTLYGGAGVNSLDGGDGDDVFIAERHVAASSPAGGENDLGTNPFDAITGSHGFDTYDASRLDAIDANLATGKVFSDGVRIAQLSEVENLIGSAFNDTLTGDGGFNQLFGGAGYDTLDGGAGDDDLWGGADNDTASYASATAGVTVSLLLQDVEQDTIGAGKDYLDSIEYLTGSKFNDTLTGDNNNNLLDGGAGADVMKGGLGDDTYVVGNAYDNVGERLNEGTDTVLASISYTLPSNVETLILAGSDNLNATGNSINNTIYGNTGNNLIDGGGGADTMYGKSGDDTYVVNNSFDKPVENANDGTDMVQSSITFTLGANLENLTLTGATAINGTGNGLDNRITGNAGNNILTGGAGADTFVFGKFGAGNGLDHLVDFVTGTDHLSFTGADYGIAAGHVLGTGELSTTGMATSAAGVGQFVYNTTTHTLSWDANGVTAGGVTDIVVFDNAATPHTGDFIFT